MIKPNNKNKGTLSVLVLVLIVAIDLFSNRPTLLNNRVAFTVTVSPGIAISSGPKPRHFAGSLRLSSPQSRSIAATEERTSFPRLTADCDNWMVTSSKNISQKDFAHSLIRSRLQPAWCVVIVGDEFDTDSEWDDVSQQHESNVIFLSAKHQAAIGHPFVQHVLSKLRREPNNSFIRRNIGYLFAIKHGAKAIYDVCTTDFNSEIDLFSPPGSMAFFHGRNRVLVKYSEDYETSPSRLCFDPQSFISPSENSTQKEHATWRFGSIEYASIGIASPFCLDVDHQRCSPRKCGTHFLAPIHNYALSNFNSTTFLHQAFWGLFLPATVEPDFRFLFAQKFLHELNLGVVFEEASTGQGSHSVGNKQVNSSDFVQFLASKESFVYPLEGANENLASRIEFLMIELFEHGYVGIDDVYSLQEWLLALIDVGYQFPSLNSAGAAYNETAASNSPVSQALAVVREPSIEGQGFLASPSFNADKNGHRYEEYLEASGNQEGSMDLFAKWLGMPKLSQHPSRDHAILKIIAMTKDEGSLLQDWVAYHGELVGFENLYIIDGSTDEDSIQFLIHAQRHWGVNVIFSSIGLDGLEGLLSSVGRLVSRASDFVAKFDTDEFLVANTRNSTCIHSHSTNLPDGLLSSDCTLSPYSVQDSLDQLRRTSTGERLRFGEVMTSQSSAAACENDDTKNDIGSFPLNPVTAAHWLKTISDARTLAGIDLGGHNNNFVSPFGTEFGMATDIGFLHFHNRCFENELFNCRKAVISHKYIDESDSDERAIEKIFALQQGRGYPVERDGFCDNVKELFGTSSQKIFFYLRYLLGCVSAENFYPSTEGSSLLQQNPDFVYFLNTARRHQGLL